MMKLKPSDPIRDIGPDEPLPIAIVFDRTRQVSDQIYDALRRAIVTLKLPPGTAISENRICRHIGASRTPVREAIIRLVDDGLIDVFPQQGSFVAPIRIGDVRESHFVRKCLELAVLKKATGNWGEQAQLVQSNFCSNRRAPSPTTTSTGFIPSMRTSTGFSPKSPGFRASGTPYRAPRRGSTSCIELAAIEGRLPMVIREHRSVVRALDGHFTRAIERMEEHLDKVMTLLDLLMARNANYFTD